MLQGAPVPWATVECPWGGAIEGWLNWLEAGVASHGPLMARADQKMEGALLVAAVRLEPSLDLVGPPADGTAW